MLTLLRTHEPRERYRFQCGKGVWRQLQALPEAEHEQIVAEMTAIAELVALSPVGAGAALGPAYCTFAAGYLLAYEVRHGRGEVTLLEVVRRSP